MQPASELFTEGGEHVVIMNAQLGQGEEEEEPEETVEEPTPAVDTTPPILKIGGVTPWRHIPVPSM